MLFNERIQVDFMLLLHRSKKNLIKEIKAFFYIYFKKTEASQAHKLI